MSVSHAQTRQTRRSVPAAGATLRDAGATLRDAAESGATEGVRPTAERYAASSQVSGVNLIGVMFAIILAAAIGMVGTKVISEVQNSITDKNLGNTDDINQTLYENATESIGTGFADAMGLTDIVFLVLMFVVIIGALFLARQAGR